MALPVYLAMTAAEIAGSKALPEKLGYMACHFSAYGTGLSNPPASLPEGSMILLNDRIPIAGHDPNIITQQLEKICEHFKASCVLLDFQRPGIQETSDLVKQITRSLSCPTGVSDVYANGSDTPVFLPPVPLDIQISEYLAPWHGREIWLEIAADALCLTLTGQGCKAAPIPPPQETPHYNDTLCCHYMIETEAQQARFLLHRTGKDLDELLAKAAAMGVTRAVGLYQELHKIYDCEEK